ncbi:MAG: Crp/Fnr family transcriptional regulator [Alphaproteobacteria bacterium]
MSDIDNISLFDSIKEPLRSEINKAISCRSFVANEQIIDLNSNGEDVIFVCEGRVRVIIYSLSGREIALDEIGEGSFFGELAAIDGFPRSANVMAVTDTTLAFLSADNFLKVLKEDASISLKVMRKLTRIMRQATTRIIDLSTLGSNNRVHGELLRLGKSAAVINNKPTLSPIPTHSEIASRVSTSRETVARVMNDLARKNIIKRTSSSIIFLDMNKLENMVEEVKGE